MKKHFNPVLLSLLTLTIASGLNAAGNHHLLKNKPTNTKQYIDETRDQTQNLSRFNRKKARVQSERIEKSMEKDPLGRPMYYADRITVKLKKGVVSSCSAAEMKATGLQSLDSKLSALNVSTIKRQFAHTAVPAKAGLPDLSRIYTASVPAGTDIHAAARMLAQDPYVEYAEPIPMMYTDKAPNDSLFTQLQHLGQIEAGRAWDLHTGEAGERPVIIGICDSGVDWQHPDLAGNIKQNLKEDADGDGHVIEWDNDSQTWIFDPDDINGLDDDDNGYMDDFIGWNFMADIDGNHSNNPDMAGMHGSHVTGLAAGVTNNRTGIASISWNVKYLPTSHGLSNDLTAIFDGYSGIIYLAENGAHIINCSWGGYGYSQAGNDVIQYATGLGSIIVTSAGNGDTDEYTYPSCYPHVLSIGSVASTDKKASYSEYGIGIDVMAPGGDFDIDGGILSTIEDGEYECFNGTSMASPVAAGLLALIKSQNPFWSNERVITQLLQTADNIDAANPDYAELMGNGRINAYRALSENRGTAPNLSLAQQDETLPLKFGLFDVGTPADANGNGSIEAGETAALNLILRNFAPFTRADEVTFILTTDDPSITLEENEYTCAVEADANVILDNVFRLSVHEDAIPHNASFEIEVSHADPVITYALNFELMVGQAGIFVWESAENGLDMSGTFFCDFFDHHKIDYSYSTSFPMSLIGFDAVLMSFGSSYNDDFAVFTDDMADAVITYLENGGKLYIEGNDALGYYQEGNDDLYELLGLEDVKPGPAAYLFVDNMVGKEGSVGEGMNFTDNTQLSPVWIDRFIRLKTAQSVLEEAFHGLVAVQNEGDFGQKSVCFSYALAYMVSGEFPTSKTHLLARILNFLDIDIPLTADFNVDFTSGHQPLTVQMTDLSYANNSPVTEWAWDFDNDGTIDSHENNPEFTYEKPGIYSVTLEVTSSDGKDAKTMDQLVSVFDGESALGFDGMNESSHAFADSNASFDVSSALTLEAWIKPAGWGALDPNGYGRIFEKESSYRLYLHNNGYPGYAEQSLVFGIEHEDGNGSVFNTPAESIVLDQWQHVAASYDAETETAAIYIDGVRQTVTEVFPPSGAIANNRGDYLLIGNSMDLMRTFEGGIDEIRIWNVVRTETQIQNNLQDYLQGTEFGLAGYWKFNEGNGYFVENNSVNSDTLFLYRTQWIQGPALGEITLVEDESDKRYYPDTFVLNHNYPNPFNPVTTIPFALPHQSHVTIQVRNVRGQLIETLTDQSWKAGRHQIEWNASSLGSGVYVIHFQTTEVNKHLKVLLLK